VNAKDHTQPATFDFCERCGKQNPAHYYADVKNRIVGCASCPDAHRWEVDKCGDCGVSAIEAATRQPHCKARQH
jgi:hypothetical protein